MFPILTFLTSSFFLIALLLAIAVIFLIIIPYIRVNSYKRKDVTTYFFPGLGLIGYFNKSFKEYGDCFGASKQGSKKTPNEKFFVTNFQTEILFNLRDPQYVKEFLQNQKYYVKTKSIDFLKELVGTGLVTIEGDKWKTHRKIISNSFHYEFLKGNLGMIQATVRELLDKIPADAYNNYSVINRIEETTGEIVGRIFFGEHLNSYSYEGKPLTRALADIITELALSGRTILAFLLGPNIMRMSRFSKFSKVLPKIKKFRSIIYGLIQDRKNQTEQSNDLLASLLATQKLEDPEQHYSDDDIINEFITFIVAGMDTTGHLISMVLYNLTQYPHYLQDLQKERDSTYNTQEIVTVETLQKMDFLHGLIKETLRFHSPAPSSFIRKATVPHKIGDLDIRKGQYVRPDYFYMFHNEKYFERPGEFDPSRWKKIDKNLDHYVFIPFSAGPRNCIGQHLALMETKIIVSEFLERFEFKLKDGYKLRMTLRFVYEPEEELVFELKKKTKITN